MSLRTARTATHTGRPVIPARRRSRSPRKRQSKVPETSGAVSRTPLGPISSKSTEEVEPVSLAERDTLLHVDTYTQERTHTSDSVVHSSCRPLTPRFPLYLESQGPSSSTSSSSSPVDSRLLVLEHASSPIPPGPVTGVFGLFPV